MTEVIMKRKRDRRHSTRPCFYGMPQLKVILDYHDLSYNTLASALGVTRQAVGQWVLGYTRPNLANLKRLCEVLVVSEEYLLRGTEGWPKKKGGDRE